MSTEDGPGYKRLKVSPLNKRGRLRMHHLTMLSQERIYLNLHSLLFHSNHLIKNECLRDLGKTGHHISNFETGFRRLLP
jgi:hypothetical protein